MINVVNQFISCSLLSLAMKPCGNNQYLTGTSTFTSVAHAELINQPPWKRILEKLTVLQLVKILPAFVKPDTPLLCS